MIKKKKKIKKKSKLGRLKEIKINLNIHIKDFNFKKKKTKKFLLEGYTVKISVVLKGREIIFKEKGIELLLNFQNNLKELFYKFSNIEFEGKTISSIVTPKKI
ncbi:MAG: translation initiation factor IF-3 [Candidatus Carsonella ruddii]